MWGNAQIALQCSDSGGLQSVEDGDCNSVVEAKEELAYFICRTPIQTTHSNASIPKNAPSVGAQIGARIVTSQRAHGCVSARRRSATPVAVPMRMKTGTVNQRAAACPTMVWATAALIRRWWTRPKSMMPRRSTSVRRARKSDMGTPRVAAPTTTAMNRDRSSPFEARAPPIMPRYMPNATTTARLVVSPEPKRQMCLKEREEEMSIWAASNTFPGRVNIARTLRGMD